MSTHARVATYQYSSGQTFYMVHCNTCNTVLNSGHHYTDRSLRFAERLADAHNCEHLSIATDRVLAHIAARLPSGVAAR